MSVLFGIKTSFSIGESILNPSEIPQLAKDAGYSAIAVADVGNINALPNLTKAAKKADVKLIMGATFNVVDDITWRPAPRGAKKAPLNPFFMPKMYAKNEKGFQDIMRLLSISNDEDHFYHKAQCELSELLETMKLGNVVVATGDAHSLFSHKRYHDIAMQLKTSVSASDFVCELVTVDSLYYQSISSRAMKFATENEVKMIVSHPCLFGEDQVDIRNTMNCITGRAEVKSIFRRDTDPSLSIKRKEDRKYSLAVIEKMSGLSDVAGDFLTAMNYTDDVADQFDYRFEKMPVSLPKLSDDPIKELMTLCVSGWKKRLEIETLGYMPEKSEFPVYLARLKYELSVLRDMKFEDYFVLVHYVVNWSKENGILVGPGRGSAGGSLVAFLLGITDVDPIRFGLIFERFINPERLDLPDIDLDFMSSRKDEVVMHLTDKFGLDRVACISNYSTLASASALRSVAKAFGLDPVQYACSKYIPSHQGTSATLEEAAIDVAQIGQFALDHPVVWRHACAIQGTFRSYSVHAAGVVVAGEPIVNRAVVESRHKNQAVTWDKRVVEDFGLVKLDILGLSTLDVLDKARDYLRETEGLEIDYTTIKLNDVPTLEAFGRGDTVGVFQFESGGMRHLLKQLASASRLTFEDISAANALFRPGPIDSGLMDQYVSIREGSRLPDYPHPSMIDALEETQSVMIYQEQTMKVARDLAGFSMAQADHLRKAMGKKDADMMASIRESFVKGCGDHSEMREDTAGIIFDQIEKFAGYGFNKSHAVEYSIIAFWCMYLKVHYPTCFYAAALTVLEDKVEGIVKDAAAAGVSVYPPDINKSSDRYEIRVVDGDDRLYAPFQVIQGLSEKGAAAIVAAQVKHGKPFENRDEFLLAVNRRACNIRAQESLDLVGAFANIEAQPPSTDPTRLKSQKKLIPGVMIGNVKIKRKITLTKPIVAGVRNIVADIKQRSETELEITTCVVPRVGSTPKIMIITDYANWSEVEKGRNGEGEACTPLLTALKNAEIPLKDVYFTSLIKCGKPEDGEFTPDMMRVYTPSLLKEIEVLKPPVILAMGSKSIRALYPDIKGKWDELCGQVKYDEDRDSSVCFGLSPMMVYFDKSKQETVNEIVLQGKELIIAT